MKRKQHGRQSSGFSRVEAIVVVGILAVLAAMLWPVWNASRKGGSRASCSNNVRYIETVFSRWAMDHGGKYPMQVSIRDGGTMELIHRGEVLEHFLALSNELKSPYCLVCPADKEGWKQWEKLQKQVLEKIIARKTNLFTRSFPISYFVGVDADEKHPQMLLTGDDNFTVDGRKPKPGLLNLWTNSQVAWTRDRHRNGGFLADGFVDTPRLQAALAATGVATNRLALP